MGKKWYTSKTMIAGMVTFGIGLLASIGVMDLASEQDTITDNITAVVVAVSGLVAMVGRIMADKQIEL